VSYEGVIVLKVKFDQLFKDDRGLYKSFGFLPLLLLSLVFSGNHVKLVFFKAENMFFSLHILYMHNDNLVLVIILLI